MVHRVSEVSMAVSPLLRSPSLGTFAIGADAGRLQTDGSAREANVGVLCAHRVLEVTLGDPTAQAFCCGNLGLTIVECRVTNMFSGRSFAL